MRMIQDMVHHLGGYHECIYIHETSHETSNSFNSTTTTKQKAKLPLFFFAFQAALKEKGNLILTAY